MNKQPVTVKARLKDFAEQPDWVKCCPEFCHELQLVIEQGNCFLMNAQVFMNEAVKCPHCARSHGLVKSLRMASPWDLILVADMYELKEGDPNELDAHGL